MNGIVNVSVADVICKNYFSYVDVDSNSQNWKPAIPAKFPTTYKPVTLCWGIFFSYVNYNCILVMNVAIRHLLCSI